MKLTSQLYLSAVVLSYEFEILTSYGEKSGRFSINPSEIYTNRVTLVFHNLFRAAWRSRIRAINSAIGWSVSIRFKQS